MHCCSFSWERWRWLLPSPMPTLRRAWPPAACVPGRTHLVIPTYDIGLPDPNAPFDLFLTSRFSYPYTVLNQPTASRAPRRWRTLNLENEYLRCSVLPDLGGHLYSCTDKINGQDLFYANTSLKFANVAYRGAWAAYGIEFNFPVSHNWMTVSPVDAAVRHDSDGSASIWIGNTDRVYGGQWRVALTLRPHRAVLEQHTSLYNGTPVRHRFYWWTNAAVRVTDDSRMLYPMRFTASHGFRDVDTWPVDHRGVDLSTIRTHTEGPVSLFSHGSREGFMGVYHPVSDSGVVHYSPPADLPAEKVLVLGCQSGCQGLARGPLRRSERVCRGAGRTLQESGDLCLPRAAGDHRLRRVLDAHSWHRRSRARDA